VPEPCERCGAPDAEKHHDDYSRPLAVRWLCRSCHLALHGCAEGGPGQPEGRELAGPAGARRG
jgi:hypothetical protein